MHVATSGCSYGATLKAHDPHLGDIKLIDVGSPEPVATATTGLRPQLARSDIQIAVYPGVATAVLVGALGLSGLISGHRIGDLIIGGAPAVLVAVVAFGLATWAAYSRILVWQA